MKNLALFFLVFFLFSCQQSQTQMQITNSTKRDSIMTKYFAVVDSLPLNDTLDANFVLLKAYKNNDIAFLQYSLNGIKGRLDEWKSTPDSIKERHHPPADSSFDEIYRFDYGRSFYPIGVTLTIKKKGSNITSELKFFMEKPPGITYDKEYSKMPKNITKKITEEE